MNVRATLVGTVGVAVVALAPALTAPAAADPTPSVVTPHEWFEEGGPYRTQQLCITDKNDRKANGETRLMRCVKGANGLWYLQMWYPSCAALPAVSALPAAIRRC